MNGSVAKTQELCNKVHDELCASSIVSSIGCFFRCSECRVARSPSGHQGPFTFSGKRDREKKHGQVYLYTGKRYVLGALQEKKEVKCANKVDSSEQFLA